MANLANGIITIYKHLNNIWSFHFYTFLFS